MPGVTSQPPISHPVRLPRQAGLRAAQSWQSWAERRQAGRGPSGQWLGRQEGWRIRSLAPLGEVRPGGVEGVSGVEAEDWPEGEGPSLRFPSLDVNSFLQ